MTVLGAVTDMNLAAWSIWVVVSAGVTARASAALAEINGKITASVVRIGPAANHYGLEYVGLPVHSGKRAGSASVCNSQHGAGV